jgi:hypothetical protein
VRRRQSIIAILTVLVVVSSTACVSRNVESIGSDEAAALSSPPAPVAATEQPESVVTVPGVDGNIKLAEGVTATPGGSLFVIVRVAGREGGPPLAVKQLGGEVPTSFRITEENAMIPGTPFVGDLEITVRLDGDGNAFSRQPGDLEGKAGPVQAGGEVEVFLAPAQIDEGEAGAGMQ